MTYNEFIQNILDTRGRFACGEEYHERHHIIPKCMGGTNDKDNLIDLFAREHFIAHKLLAQENPDNNSLAYAWGCMAWQKNKNQERVEVSPEEYEEAKIACAKAISENAKKRLSNPENNPNYGKHLSEETKQKISKAIRSLPDEWRNNISEKIKIYYANPENHPPNYGKHHTEEAKRKMKENRKVLRGKDHPMYGRHHTEESRRKMGQNHKDMRGKNNARSRTVNQYTMDGEFVMTFESTGEASRATGVDSSSICRCANGILKSAGGFNWKYVDEKKE